MFPEKLTNALEWLKANNSLYANVNVNKHWIDECEANDSDVLQSLVTQPETENTECVPRTGGNSSCDYASNIAIASGRLTTLARDNSFTVHDVPGDGNRLFNAVAYQLDSVSASEMREIVAKHLESNSTFYRDFQAQPVHSGNAYNADTEAPSDQDAIIDSIHDIEQQIQLRWERYIHRFRNGGWGVHLAIQSISNVFNVLSSKHSNVIRNAQEVAMLSMKFILASYYSIIMLVLIS